MKNLIRTVLVASVGILGPVAFASDELPPQSLEVVGAAAPPQESLPSLTDSREPDLDVSIQKALTDAHTEYQNILASRAKQPESLPETPEPTRKAARPAPVSLDSLASQVHDLKNKLVVEQASLLALQAPRRARVLGAKTIYSYNEAAVYEVTSSVDHVTDIQLKPGESLTATPTSGDTVRWSIGIVKSGVAPGEVTHLVVKPLDDEIQTNLVVVTDQHIYQLRLKSGDFHMPVVAWNYPMDNELQVQAALRRQESQETTITPDALRFSYNVSGERYPWKPVRVFDDGNKTFIQMPKDMRVSDAPALFLIEEGEEPLLVNYRVKGDFYIVDRLIDSAELRVGPHKRVTIELERPNWFERNFL